MVTPSEDATHRNPPACKHQEVDGEKEHSEHAECPNGSTQSEGGEAPAFSGDSDSGKWTLGLEGEGVCEGKRGDRVAVSAISCGEQQQEEVDSGLRVIREALHTQTSHAVSKTKTHNKIQSGNTQEGTMGQTHGLLAEKEEKNKARGDLPEEREGEGNSWQETFLLSGNTQPHDGQRNSKTRSHFYLNLNVNTSEKGKEVQGSGNGNERISTGSTIRDQDTKEDLDSLSFRPNMAPGPVHNVRLEPSPVVEHTLDATTGNQIDAPPETASDCSEQVSSDSVKEPPPCDDVTDAQGKPDRSVLEVSFTTEKSGEEIQVVQTLLPETGENSLPGLKRDIQPIISPEISEETSQIFTKSYCGVEEPSQEHSEQQSDAKIMDIMGQDQDPIRSQSPPLVLDQILTVLPELMVSDFNPEETGCSLESKLGPLAFQTPPESPCEFFSVDGFIKTNDTIETTSSASLELDPPTGSRQTMEQVEKVETELLEMCENSKKSPLTILCGSFSKLTIRGSPLDPPIDSTTSETIQETSAKSALAGDLKTCTTPSEMEEPKEEVMKLEPKLVEKCEKSESSEIVNNMTAEPLCDSISKENLSETAVITYAVGSETPNDQPSESKDVQEEWMTITTQLGENPENVSLPCKILPLSTSVSKNITDVHSEVTNFEAENIKTFEGFKKFEDPQPELMPATDRVVDTSLRVSNYEKNILEQLEVMTFKESFSGTSLDLHHQLITSSEEAIVETSLDQLPMVKISEESTQDQELKAMSSEESIRGSSPGPSHDFTSSVETTGEASLGRLFEGNSLEESVQVQQLGKSRNDPHDPQHEVMTFETSIRETLYLHHNLITPSENTVKETSSGPLPEVNSSDRKVVHQQLEVVTSEESIRGTSSSPNHDLTMSFDEALGITSLGPSLEVKSSKENLLDQQPEATTCEKSQNAASQDTKLEKSIQYPHHELTTGETALVQKSEITAFEESISETPNHTQLEGTTCEENLGASLEPLPEAMSCKMDTHIAEVPSEIVIRDAPISGNDSGLALENISTSGSLEISDQSVDLNSVIDLDGGTAEDMDASSFVEVHGGLIQGNVGVHKSGTLDDNSHSEEECGEELKEEQVAGEKRFNINSMRGGKPFIVIFYTLLPWRLLIPCGYGYILKSFISLGLDHHVSFTSTDVRFNAIVSQNSS